MSILFQSSSGCLIAHDEYIKSVYRNVQSAGKGPCDMCYTKSMFLIETPYMRDLQAEKCIKMHSTLLEDDKVKKRKRKLSKEQISSAEVNLVVTLMNDLVTSSRNHGHLVSMSIPSVRDNNIEARCNSLKFFTELSCQVTSQPFSGGNSNILPVRVECNDEEYVIPPGCRFYCGSVKNLKTSLPEDAKFDFILLDPPWWNKYIRRRKSKEPSAGYKMMYNEEIASLPIELLLEQHGLVAVWCTNCASHINAVKHKIFSAWNVQYIATWFWVKVTKSGKPVCQFSEPPGKQPYERIIFGSREERTDRYHQPENNKCIVSVPSAIHSHKPPLTEILKEYLPSSPQCLELFARYLLPNWTSFGDQVLTLQNTKLFSQCGTDNDAGEDLNRT